MGFCLDDFFLSFLHVISSVAWQEDVSAGNSATHWPVKTLFSPLLVVCACVTQESAFGPSRALCMSCRALCIRCRALCVQGV